MNKIYPDATAALAGVVQNGQTIAVGGFGLCGIPEALIAALLVEGKTSKTIARQIDLSPRTVEMHRAKLMRKFSAATSSELVHKLVGLHL